MYLPKEDNILLRRSIELQYTREETAILLATITTAMNNPFVYQIAAKNLIEVVNSIFIDNILRFVKNKDCISIVMGMQNNTLGLMMDVGYRHYVELIGEELSQFQTSVEVEQIIIKAISSYINNYYLTNKETLDEAILKLFETLYNNFNDMEMRQHRVVFLESIRPAIILIGDQHAGDNANPQYS